MDAFCDGFKTGNAVLIYDQQSTHLQGKASAYVIQQQMNRNAQRGGIKTCTYSAIQQNGSTASTFVTGTLGDGSQFPTTSVILIQENGTWKIDDMATVKQ